jgi:hypothetical protein
MPDLHEGANPRMEGGPPMSARFTNSAPPRPHYESSRYRPSPARRQHIFGKVQGIPDRNPPSLWLCALALWLIAAALMLRSAL